MTVDDIKQVTYSDSGPVHEVMGLAKAAHESYSKACLTLNLNDIVYAEKALSSAIAKIHSFILDSINQPYLLLEFGEIQKCEQKLERDLDRLTLIHKALSMKWTVKSTTNPIGTHVDVY